MSKNQELELIDLQITRENENHRRRIEQLRQRKQQIKNMQAKKREQEKLQKTYRESINELLAILTN